MFKFLDEVLPWRLRARLKAVQEAKDKLAEEVKSLRHVNKKPKRVKTVKKVQPDRNYFVVTQGGYYQVRGSNLLSHNYGEVTSRAYKNGFVVETVNDAYELQSQMRRLVGKG